MNLLFWIYLVNSVIIINHELDSAYWQEWKLISPKLKNGINGFLIIHFPLFFILLIGLVLVKEHQFAGLIISLVLSISGIFAFFFHFYHITKGKPEFNTLISKTIIISTLIISIIQIILTISLMT
jgi:uncharacterized membrane protein